MGATIIDRDNDRIVFRVYAFYHPGVTLLLKTERGVRKIAMEQEKPHLFRAVVEGAGREPLYQYYLEGEEKAYPDPYSHYQPQGVHGFSQVVDHASYPWGDGGWPGINWREAIIYELHPGTFSEAGTFRGAAAKLGHLKELGVNTVELMPVNQTPGRWNWGYDGTGLFTVNCNYGTPNDLKYLVDRCHREGLAVILDVVYNHFGPEGNYLSRFGPYFTGKYKTPWGAAVNYDDAGCAVVREMVLQNVRHWVEHYHLDGLRLDAVHAIKDESPRHILKEIAETARSLSERLGRQIVIIAETDENDVRIINPPEQGGYGVDAQWMDDFHHTVHTVLTGEDKGYYADYGDIRGLEKVYRNYLYTGEYSRFWKKKRGTDGSAAPGHRFVVAIQTHDQVGNRAAGERLSRLVDFPYLKAAAGLLIMAPYIPMLFMGEEYAEENPFLYFTDYTDPELKKAVSEGRRREFADFGWEEIPDPEEDTTFYTSRLTPRERWSERQRQIFAYYKDLLKLRRAHPALRIPDKEGTAVEVDPERKLVKVTRESGSCRLTGLFNLGERPVEAAGLNRGAARVIFDSEHPRYRGRAAEEASAALLPGQFILVEKPRRPT